MAAATSCENALYGARHKICSKMRAARATRLFFPLLTNDDIMELYARTTATDTRIISRYCSKFEIMPSRSAWKVCRKLP